MAASEFLSHFTPWALWNYYITYLWNYESTSWVARTASTFHALSVIILLPLACLAFMDIASYVIARTLGIVDDTKASTSDTVIPIPTIRIEEPTPVVEPKTVNALRVQLLRNKEVTGVESIDTSDTHAYFTGEEYNHKLAGDDVFSPAPSTPPSPTLSKKQFKETGSTTSFSAHTTSEATDSDDVIQMPIRRR